MTRRSLLAPAGEIFTAELRNFLKVEAESGIYPSDVFCE
jgi:hypothetical protein